MIFSKLSDGSIGSVHLFIMAYIPDKTAGKLKPGRVIPYEQKHPETVKKTAERGYGSRWQKVSKLYLNEHPLCERCELRGYIQPAVLVHHKTPIRSGGEIFDFENLEALCHKCHVIRHYGRGGGSKSSE